jgi:uncharacterized membrane protein
MSIEITTTPQAQTEIKKYVISFEGDLLTAVTVASATVTHIPPQGASTTPTVEVTTPIAVVTFGPVTSLGRHIVDVLATYSNGEKSAARLNVDVTF